MGARSPASAPGSKAEYELRPPPSWAGLDTSAVLTAGAVAFLVALQREFGRARRGFLLSRQARQSQLDTDAILDFSPATRALRSDDSWHLPEKHLLVDGQPILPGYELLE